MDIPQRTDAASLGHGSRGPTSAGPYRSVKDDQGLEQLLAEREQTIYEFKETIEILELKITKLEQLVRLKDSKISKLQGALARQES
jgi:hypothetical protein